MTSLGRENEMPARPYWGDFALIAIAVILLIWMVHTW